jgi:hypothetical protein
MVPLAGQNNFQRSALIIWNVINCIVVISLVSICKNRMEYKFDPARGTLDLFFTLKSIPMLVIAHHHIQDTEKFWSAAKVVGENLPFGFKLHLVYPSMNMKISTCLWEAPSVGSVQEFLDENVGSVSKNFCYIVNQKASIGLPTLTMDAVIN